MNSEMKSLKSEVKSLTDKLNHTETRKNQVSQLWYRNYENPGQSVMVSKL